MLVLQHFDNLICSLGSTVSLDGLDDLVVRLSEFASPSGVSRTDRRLKQLCGSAGSNLFGLVGIPSVRPSHLVFLMIDFNGP